MKLRDLLFVGWKEFKCSVFDQMEEYIEEDTLIMF
jgi:hypothetical protein